MNQTDKQYPSDEIAPKDPGAAGREAPCAKTTWCTLLVDHAGACTKINRPTKELAAMPVTLKTIPGLYAHYKGGRYRVTGTAIVSTNGPSEGKTVVEYVSLTTGRKHSRDETEFHEAVSFKTSDGMLITAHRFTLVEAM